MSGKELTDQVDVHSLSPAKSKIWFLNNYNLLSECKTK